MRDHRAKDVDVDNYPGPSTNAVVWSLGKAKENFDISPAHKTPRWLKDNLEMDLLRRHDYYEGWLDCMHARGQHNLYLQGGLEIVDIEYLYDSSNYRSPHNTGQIVGMTFGWSVLCTMHGVPERDNRLDDRKWELGDLEPKGIPTRQESYFWQSVKAGKAIAGDQLKEKLRTGSWQLSTPCGGF